MAAYKHRNVLNQMLLDHLNPTIPGIQQGSNTDSSVVDIGIDRLQANGQTNNEMNGLNSKSGIQTLPMAVNAQPLMENLSPAPLPNYDHYLNNFLQDYLEESNYDLRLKKMYEKTGDQLLYELGRRRKLDNSTLDLLY